MEDTLFPEELPQVPGLDAVPTSDEGLERPPAAAGEGERWREEAPGDEPNVLHVDTAAGASLYEGGREVLAEDGYHPVWGAAGGEGWTGAQGEAAAGMSRLLQTDCWLLHCDLVGPMAYHHCLRSQG